MNFIKKNIVYLAWLQALVAMFMSLYFSEIRALPPCVLCWYQRIVMYPLVAILPVGIMKNDKNLPLYVLPLSITGLIIAIYHNLLYYKILPESIAPCRAGVSCTTKLIEWFGFVTIPLMSLAAFTVITICMVIYWKINNVKK